MLYENFISVEDVQDKYIVELLTNHDDGKRYIKYIGVGYDAGDYDEDESKTWRIVMYASRPVSFAELKAYDDKYLGIEEMLTELGALRDVLVKDATELEVIEFYNWAFGGLPMRELTPEQWKLENLEKLPDGVYI